MTHGVIKKKNHHDIQEIERARRLLEDAGFGKKRKKA